MLEQTDAVMNEVLEIIMFVLAYPTVMNNVGEVMCDLLTYISSMQFICLYVTVSSYVCLHHPSDFVMLEWHFY
jgi:hypothetical protein